jgi:hypothetical protein
MLLDFCIEMGLIIYFLGENTVFLNAFAVSAFSLGEEGWTHPPGKR